MNDTGAQGRVLTDEERARAMLDQLKSVHAFDVARDLIVALVNFSSPKLGLSDETRAVRDLGDVRLSIELIRAILEVVERDHGEKKTADVHDTLAQLQLAYAHAVQLDRAEKEAGEEAGAGAPAAAGPAEPPAARRAADEAGEGATPPEAPAEADEADQGATPPEAPAEADEAPAARRAAKTTPAHPKRPAQKKPAEKKRPQEAKPTAARKPVTKKKPAAKKKPAGES